MINKEIMNNILLMKMKRDHSSVLCIRCGCLFETRIESKHLCLSCYQAIDNMVKKK